jgi:hypothetical protein
MVTTLFRILKNVPCQKLCIFHRTIALRDFSILY